MASEKKYFPERKRNKKAGPTGETIEGDEGDEDLIGDGASTVQTETKPAGGDVMDLLDFGNSSSS